MIRFQAEDTPLPPIDPAQLSVWIETVAARQGYAVGQINYLFCSEAKILEVNRSFLQHDYYTDIITFDYSERNFIAGDIYISPETVRSNALLFGTNFDEELLRVIIHGVLHLCGQGDKSEIEAAEMRQKENEALRML